MEDDTQLDLKPGIYKYDSSYRSNHVDVQDLVGMTGKLYVKVIAKSGSALVDYYGIGSEKFGAGGLWDAIVPITASSEDGQNFFQPFTTTLIELRLNRDPKPFHCRSSQALLLRRVGTGRQRSLLFLRQRERHVCASYFDLRRRRKPDLRRGAEHDVLPARDFVDGRHALQRGIQLVLPEHLAVVDVKCPDFRSRVPVKINPPAVTTGPTFG